MLTVSTKFAEMYTQNTKKKTQVYETVDGFVADLCRKAPPDVRLENMKTLFYYFVLFLMLVSTGFLVDLLLSKHLRTIKHNLASLLVQSASLLDAVLFGGLPRVVFCFTPTNL